jgi:dimethyladenosine transferase 1
MGLPRRLPPIPNTADILRMYGIRAQKHLSQNFILHPTILDKFAKSAGQHFGQNGLKGKRVIEVGPGPGGITRALLAHGASEVHVIEKDERFLPSLRLLQEASAGALKINMGDVMNYNMSSKLYSFVV